MKLTGRILRTLSTGALALMPVALAACGGGDRVVPTNVDPRGSDALIAFSWRINGQDPAMVPAACSEAGVQFIRMNVVDEQNQAHPIDTFQWDCNLGRYRSTRAEVRAGTFRVFWEAVTGDGRRVSLAPARRENGAVVPAPEPVTFVRGETADFDRGNTTDPATIPGQPTNFATGSGRLQAAVRYQAPGAMMGASPVDCAGAGVTTITWQLRAPNGVAVDDHSMAEACAQYPTITWNSVIWDNYTLVLAGRDASGATVVRGSCPNLLARRAPTQSMYNCVFNRAQ